MRIIVLSDTHGSLSAFEQVFSRHPEADRYIHLGDGARDVAAFRERHPGCNLYSVRGNTDFSSGDPLTGEMEVEGKKILYLHGHIYHVKSGLTELQQFAQKKRANVVLFGHTHDPLYDFLDGVHYLNPGNCSTTCIRFGIVDITAAGIVCVATEIDWRD